MGGSAINEPFKLGKSRYGVGAIATRDIAKGEEMSRCRILLIPVDEVGPQVQRYVFHHSDRNHALAMGSISFVNHDRKPNAELIMEGKRIYTLVARKKIGKGQEIFIDYGYTPTV